MKQATLDAIKAFAEGKRIAEVEKGSPVNKPFGHKDCLGSVTFFDAQDYQICTTMQVNGREYPCPVTKLEDAQYYYLPSPTVQFGKKFYCVQVFKYMEDPFEPMLSSGLIHLSAEAADAHARALFGYPDRPEPTPEEATQASVNAVMSAPLPGVTPPYVKWAEPGEISGHDTVAIQKQEEIEQAKADAESFEAHAYENQVVGNTP